MPRLGVTRINIFLIALTFGIVLWVSQQGLFPYGYFEALRRLHGAPMSHHEPIHTNAGSDTLNPVDLPPPPEQPHGQNDNNNNDNDNDNTGHMGGTPISGPHKGAILLTGGLGHLGTALIKRLTFEGEKVISLDLLHHRHALFFKSVDYGPKVVFVRGDVRNETLVESIFHEHEIRGVIHLAAITKESSCASAPKYCHSNNVGGTEVMMRILSHLPKEQYPVAPWFIFASSLQHKNRHIGVSSTDRDLVLQTKIDAEQLIWKYKGGEGGGAGREGRHVRSMILRLGHLYGAFDGESRTKLFPRLHRNAVNHLPVYYYLHDNPVHNFFELLHMDDAINAFKLASSALDKMNGKHYRDLIEDSNPLLVYEEDSEMWELDISSGEVIRLQQIIQRILNATRSSSKTILLPAPGSRRSASAMAVDASLNGPPAFLPADLAMAKKHLGYEPKITFEDGLGWYAEEIEHRTLHYLNEKSKIYCLTSHDSPANQEVETHPMYQNVRQKFHYIQQRTEHYKHVGPCSLVFKSFELDGIRAKHVDRAICRNHNGTQPVPHASWCDELMGAEQYVVTGWTRDEWFQETCGNNSKMKDMPTCEYDCDHPTICVRTGRCQCVDMDRCNEDKFPNPPISVAIEENLREHSHFNASALTPLLMTWLGRHLPPTYPKINTLPLDQSIGENLEACRGVERNKSCFGVTQRILDAFQDIQVPMLDADMNVVPFYHACSMSVYRYYTKAFDVFPHPNMAKNFLWIMAHDWSKCEVFRWSVEELRRGGLDRPAMPLFSPMVRPPSFVLQTNGDTNTNCFNPAVDVVIPPEGCNTADVLDVPIHSLRSMAEREIDVLHLSTPMGTGGLLRLLLNCEALYNYTHYLDDTNPNNVHIYNIHDATAHDNITMTLFESDTHLEGREWRQRILTTKLGRKKQNRAEYLDLLGNSRFCLCPRGVAGWAPRAFDAIAMGCIPVFISDYTVYPFSQVLDYTKFAVFVRESEVPVLQDILRSISLERMEEMQWALKVVRSSLLYDPAKSLLGVHTPIDFALRLLSLQMMRGEQKP